MSDPNNISDAETTGLVYFDVVEAATDEDQICQVNDMSTSLLRLFDRTYTTTTLEEGSREVCLVHFSHWVTR